MKYAVVHSVQTTAVRPRYWRDRSSLHLLRCAPAIVLTPEAARSLFGSAHSAIGTPFYFADDGFCQRQPSFRDEPPG